MKVLFRFIIVISLCTLAACSSLPDPTASTTPFQTITFGAAERRRDQFLPLIERFEANNPDIRVRFIGLDPNQTPTLDVAVRTVDTLFGFPVSASDGESGLVRNLAAFADADPTFDRGDFYSSVLAQGQALETLYFLPISINIPLLAYNRDLWRTYSLEEPQPTWTWNDLLTVARQLSADQSTLTPIIGVRDPDGAFSLYQELVRSRVDFSQMQQLSILAEQKEMAAILTNVQELAADGVIDPTVGGPSLQDIENVRAGRVGAWPATWEGALQSAGPLGFEVGLVPFPGLLTPDEITTLGVVMSSGTEYPDAAWRWLSFLSRQPLARSEVSQSRLVISARRSDSSTTMPSNLVQGVVAEAIAVLDTAPSAPQTLETQRSVNALLRGALAYMVRTQKTSIEALQFSASQISQSEVLAAQPANSATSQSVVVFTPAPLLPTSSVTRIRFSDENMFGNTWSDPIVSAFETEHPEIQVEMINNQLGVRQPTLSQAAAGADCFAYPSPPTSSEITATRNLQPLIDADTTFPRDDYLAVALQPYERDGFFTGLPYTYKFPTLYFNKPLFNKNGISYPTSDWTLKDVFEVAEQLRLIQSDVPQYGFQADGVVDLALSLDQAQVALTIGLGDTQRPNYTDPEVVFQLQQYIDRMRRITPFGGTTIYESATSEAEVVNIRQVGMFFWPDPLSWVAAQAPDTFEVVVLSNIPTTAYYPIPGLFISAQTDKVDACWQFIRYLSNTDIGGVFSARQSLGQQHMLSPLTLPGAENAYELYRERIAQPSTVESSVTFLRDPIAPYWLFQALDAALRGENLDRALQHAQQITEQFLLCTSNSGQSPIDCAKAVDSTFVLRS